MDHLRSPYGDLLATPSRYSCYGPLPSLMTAGLSRVIPVDSEMRYAIAGRTLNLCCWVIAGFFLGLISGRVTAGLAMACALPLAISHTSFMWTFRVDSFVALWESAILLCLIRSRTWRSCCASVIPLLCALALTKPPALVDVVPLTMVALSLFSGSKYSFISKTGPSLVIGAISSGLLLLIVDVISGGWMLNNIIREQLNSGWSPGSSIGSNVGGFFLRVSVWPLLLWGAWGPASSLCKNASWATAALAISLAICGAASMKYGADVNYYIPALVILSACAAMRLTSPPQSAVFIAALCASALPLTKSEAIHRNIGDYPGNQRPVSEFIVESHKNDTTLTEDPFFSVLAGHQPLVTDIFQYNIAAHKRGFVPEKLAATATTAWGGARLRDLLSNWGKQSTASPPYPAGIPYMPEAMIYKAPAGLDVSNPPHFPNFHRPVSEYLRKIAVPAGVLLLAAIFWGPGWRAVKRRKSNPAAIST